MMTAGSLWHHAQHLNCPQACLQSPLLAHFHCIFPSRCKSYGAACTCFACPALNLCTAAHTYPMTTASANLACKRTVGQGVRAEPFSGMPSPRQRRSLSSTSAADCGCGLLVMVTICPLFFSAICTASSKSWSRAMALQQWSAG